MPISKLSAKVFKKIKPTVKKNNMFSIKAKNINLLVWIKMEDIGFTILK